MSAFGLLPVALGPGSCVVRHGLVGEFQLRQRMRVLRNIQRRLPSANHIGFDAGKLDACRLIQKPSCRCLCIQSVRR